MIERRIRVEAEKGLTPTIVMVIARRVANLPSGTRLWLFGPDGEGVEWSPVTQPSGRLVSVLKEVGKECPHGSTVKVKAEGPGAELAVAEIENILSCPATPTWKDDTF